MEINMNCVSCKLSSLIKKYNIHSHDCWEIVCQLEGSVKTQVGDKTFTFSAGEVMIIPPNVMHKGSSDGFFKDLSLTAYGMELKDFEVLTDSDGEIASMLSVIARLYIEHNGNYKPVADSLAQAVCQLIKYKIGFSTSSPLVEQVKKEIYDNFSNPDFDLAATISKTNFDKDYFRRCFKKETGKTPYEYLVDIRINNAKQLLADSKHISVGAIAQSSGFSDSLYFSTCFKKHTGLCPLAYRKKFTNGSAQ